MCNISQIKKRSKRLLGASLILAALVGAMAACSFRPEQKRYTFTVETAEASSLEDAPTALTPYGMAERHKYMDYTVKSDNGITVYVSSGAFSRVELLQALEDGRITPEEILAQAESDARQELCKQEIVCSRNNLTTFVYRYPEYSLAVLNDMFENGREEQYLIRQILFSKPDASFLQPSLVAMDDEAHIRVDYPDWGVTVEAKDVTSEEMNLVCTQSGKALDGELYLSTLLSIARKTEDGWELLEPEQYEIPSYGEAAEAGRIIPRDSQVVYPVHWRDMVGALAPGLYNFRFYIYKFDQAGQSLDGQKMKVQVNILPEGQLILANASPELAALFSEALNADGAQTEAAASRLAEAFRQDTLGFTQALSRLDAYQIDQIARMVVMEYPADQRQQLRSAIEALSGRGVDGVISAFLACLE